MRRSLKRAIELVVPVQVTGGEAHLLQCDLDENSVAAVACGEIVRVNQVFVAYRPNSVCHAYCCLQLEPVDGPAEESWSRRALICSPIENCFFSKRPFSGSSRHKRKIEVVSSGQSGRAGPQSRVYKGFSSIPLLQKLGTLSLGLPLGPIPHYQRHV
jgi:hypothetical protein